MNTQEKRNKQAPAPKSVSSQPPNTPGTPPQQPQPERTPEIERPQREIQQPNIPERPTEKPNERPFDPTIPANDPGDHDADARWSIPGARTERVNQPKESEHAPSHVDYLEPNRKD